MKEKLKNIIIEVVAWLCAIVIFGGIGLMLFGCTTTRYVPVVERHTDTLRITQYLRDSVYIHDSTYIHEKGDTVFFEKWHTRWRDRVLHDTIYQSKTDSIPKPYPVPAELTKWQRLKVDWGGWAFLGIGVVLIISIFYIIRRYRPLR